ncbi:MAG: hypothetical protein HY301_11230 [Verrucomicrobia bacterium]|nr:hypothetical protein [Verrucomicrobiota bacterium]
MKIFLKGCWCVAMSAAFIAQAAERELPKFESLSGLIHSNLAGVTDGELDRAGAQGLLSHFKGRVVLVGTNGAAATKAGASPVTKQTTFDGAFGYVRIARVESGLAEKFAAALEKHRNGKKTKGLVIDLRFANGLDYAEAAKAADLFIAGEKELLDWGTGRAKSTTKENPFRLPTMVLVNAQTRGAAEAFAAVLREARAGLLIGGVTAGEANLFREFALDGQRVRIASGKVKLGGGEAMPAGGVTPDILVNASLEEEKAFQADPYKSLGTDVTAGTAGAATSTNSPRHRVNEADLVRLQKEGKSWEAAFSETNALTKVEASQKIMRDPALARALDLLKGLAIVKPGK